MDMVAKLPSMEDAALKVLHANAERLEKSGAKAQRAAAATLLPAIVAEIEARQTAKDSAKAVQRQEKAAEKAAAKTRVRQEAAAAAAS